MLLHTFEITRSQLHILVFSSTSFLLSVFPSNSRFFWHKCVMQDIDICTLPILISEIILNWLRKRYTNQIENIIEYKKTFLNNHYRFQYQNYLNFNTIYFLNNNWYYSKYYNFPYVNTPPFCNFCFWRPGRMPWVW